MRMIAKKPFTYATRRLLPGDDFETKRDIDGKLLFAVGKARYARAEVTIPVPPKALMARVAPPPPAAPAVTPDPVGSAAISMPNAILKAPGSYDLPTLRADYHRLVGKKPFNGWSADVLREKIASL